MHGRVCVGTHLRGHGEDCCRRATGRLVAAGACPRVAMNELDAEYQRLALEARDWIEAVTKKKFAPGDFIEALSDGVMLCR